MPLLMTFTHAVFFRYAPIVKRRKNAESMRDFQSPETLDNATSMQVLWSFSGFVAVRFLVRPKPLDKILCVDYKY
jgi:hypothetical protein